MKEQIIEIIKESLSKMCSDGMLSPDYGADVTIERTRDKQYGDFASNIAMRLAKVARRSPRQLAQEIIDSLPPTELITKVEIAGPGFINFYLCADVSFSIIKKIHESAEKYGRSTLGVGKKVQIEFVSANPTGPLHVGHGRGAAYGAAVADLLAYAGFDVHREYYVNDAGRQMDILATSVWLRYLEQNDVELVFPSNGYKGRYVFDIADKLTCEVGRTLVESKDDIFAGVVKDEPKGGDKEKHIDGLIANTKNLLGEINYRKVFDTGLNGIIDDIRDDLEGFGIEYQEWFSERSLMEDNKVEEIIDDLQRQNYIYEKDGALWFKTSEMGDEKDRPVKRSNGDFTYFASDIAYHLNKYERGFDKIIDVWGADHHGYIARVKAAITAVNKDPEKLKVLLVQFAILYRNGEKAPMSTRSGEFVTLRELRDEVGRDAARFFYVMRKAEQHLDFDLDLAKSQSSDNPVYYIQYAHARVCSVFRQLTEKGMEHNVEEGFLNVSLLIESHESALLTTLGKYPEVIESAAQSYEPHMICHYLKNLANEFHTYYNAHMFIVESAELRNARLNLILAVKQVLQNGLGLLGVSAPEEM